MISRRLKIARSASNFTQEELGARVNTTKGTISNYENGHSTPSNEMLVLLSDVLEVSTDFLLGKPDASYMKEDDKKSAIIDKITTEFPDAELMFNDLASFTADDMQEVYDYIKFKKSQIKGDN